MPRKQALHLDNLGEVIAASKSSVSRGTNQFETPRSIAAALSMLLTSKRNLIFDPQCGHGELIHGCRNDSTKFLLGSDIDPTACLPRIGSRTVAIADFTRLFPVLCEVNFRCDLIVANPPFSLQWDATAFRSIPSVENYLNHAGFGALGRKKPTLDSTLATYLACLHLLSSCGEGMMICNHATAKRLIAPHEAARHIYYWLVLPNFFPGTGQSMEIACLYFAKDHKPDAGKPIVPVEIESSHPSKIEAHLRPLRLRKLVRGQRLEVQGYSNSRFLEQIDRFDAATQEYQRRHEAALARHGGWNIYLDRQGRIVTYLTPFQRLNGTIPGERVEELLRCEGKTPLEMAIMRETREILLGTVEGGIWRVHPALLAAVQKAIEAYHRSRSPFVRLSPVQRLGFLDEHDAIEACTGALPGFTAGKSYELKSTTIENKKTELRPRPTEEDPEADEEVEISGNELLFLIRDDDELLHAFSQYELDQKEHAYCFYHALQDLLDNFTIPDVPDVADRDPALYQTYRERLLALETA